MTKQCAVYTRWISALKMKVRGFELPDDERVLMANLHSSDNWELIILKEWIQK